jgi:ATP-dependent RNA helicase SUPV3L1/SUV3
LPASIAICAEVAPEGIVAVPEAPTLAATVWAEEADRDQASAEVQATQAPVVELIEVWRPVRREEQRGARGEQATHRRRARRSGRRGSGSEGATATAVSGAPGALAETSSPSVRDGERREARHDRRDRRHPSEESRIAKPPRQGSLRRDERRTRHDLVAHPTGSELPVRQGRADRPDRDPALRAKYIKGRHNAAAQRNRAPDPDSPFAKLAKLKEQLETGAKEPR